MSVVILKLFMEIMGQKIIKSPVMLRQNRSGAIVVVYISEIKKRMTQYLSLPKKTIEENRLIFDRLAEL